MTTGAIVAFKLTGAAPASNRPGSRGTCPRRSPAGHERRRLRGGRRRSIRGTLTPAQRAQRAKPAVLYALDAATGKELWNSGTAITAPVFGVGPSGGDGQVYVVSHDGTVYVFGMPVER